MLTLEQLKKVFIPINVYNKPNNLKDTRGGVQLYNDSVNLYEALSLITPGSGGATDLTNTQDSTTISIFSSTGTDTILPAATTSLAGVMSAQDKTRLNALITLSGVSGGSLNLGTFTGAVIPDNVDIKTALQSLETTLGSIPVISTGSLVSASTPITITNGTNAVVGSGTTLTFVPSNVILSTLGGSLTLDQLDTTGASTGQFISFNGTDWVATTYTPPIQDHNTLTGKQGGISTEYYHLNQSVYNKLNSATTSTVLGRGAGTGEMDLISVAKSLVLIGGELRLNNDLASPGNNKYYGTDASGVKGFHDATVFTGVTSISVTDNGNLDFTVTSPTTTPVITADLTDTGVAAGVYGDATSVGVFTVDTKGRLTDALVTPINIPASSVSDFNEALDDRVKDLLVAGTNITLTYNDVANTLTIDSTGGGVGGTGVANRVAYWSNPTTLTTDADLAFDGTYLTLGNPLATTAKFTTKGVGGSLATFGYIHQNSTNTEVFKLADNGAVTIGAFGEVYIHPDSINLSTGGTFPINVSGGDLYLYSDQTVVVEGGGSSTNLPSFKSVATRSTTSGNLYNAQITGDVGMTIGGTNSFTDLLIDTRVNQTLHTGSIRSLHIKPVVTASNNYTGVEIDVPSTETALKVTSGEIRFELPSSATGDLFYRDATGKLVNLGIGSASEVLGSTGTIPAWTTTAGSLPGGTNGDILIYSGGSWVSGTPQKEKISGITGTGFNLGVTPLPGMIFILYRNGVYMDDTDDYSIMGNSITMTMPLISSDKITAIYYI